MIKTYKRSEKNKSHSICRVCNKTLKIDMGIIFSNESEFFDPIIPLCSDCQRALMDKMRDIICWNTFDIDETKGGEQNAKS